uniref:Protein TIC 214 n=1 Tax=Curculigo orchioides TaxID=681286 RepID=A0A7S6VKQ4_9ASPA|nr:hypothetical chloroplast RF1 [Curculigo orchioides]QOW40572.1 hypothetical chloroplast RF1 [Curculigo orchioides]
MPSPIVTKKLKETSETEEKEDPDKIDETEEIRVNGKEKTKDEFHFHFKETCYKDSSVYEDSYLDTYQDNWELGRLKEEKNEKTYFKFEKPLVTFLFDYKRWNRPSRYIKNDRFENAVRNEMSQYFFYTCPSNGKQIISFTYPPSLSTFSEMIERKISLYTKETHEDLYSFWIYTNEQKKCNLNNELISRIKILEKGSFAPDILEKRTRLCDDENEQKYLPKMDDPFLNGPYRGTIKKFYSRKIMNDLITSTENSIAIFWINKIHGLFSNDYREFEHKKSNRESLGNSISNFLTSIDKLSFESARTMDLESQTKSLKFLFDVITTNPNDQRTILNKKKSIGMEEISKRVSRWSYKLTHDLEEEEEENDKESAEDHEIRSRKAKKVVIYTDNDGSANSITSASENTTSNSDQAEELSLTRYSQQSDFRRGIIKGSMRAQRRKTVTWDMFQANVHSPLFLDRIDKTFFFSSFYISKMRNILFRNWSGREPEFKISDFKEKETKEKEKKKENERIAISEAWDTFIFTQVIRGSMLVTQSFFRKHIVLPLLIIAKNIGRMLLFQFPEWYEDFKEWKKEMHVKCTYNGVQLSETEFPKNWLTDGIQIKILFPFCLKPWRKSKVQSHYRDPMKKREKKDNFCFLTVWGMEAELPFGSPRNRPSFFEPVWKELEKKMRKVKNTIFLVLRVLKEKGKGFLKVLKEKTKWVIKIVLAIKLIIREFAKINPIFLFKLGRVKVYELNKNGKDSKKNNKIIRESAVRIRSMNSANYSLIEKKMKDLTDKTITIRNQIEQITKDKKRITLIFDDKRSESQKDIWQIIKKKNIRLIRKSHYFLKSFIEKIYMNILLCTINIFRINAQLFFDSKKQIMNKSVYNDETNQKIIDETNQNTTSFISTIKRSFSNNNISKKNSNIYCDLSSLSQAYVFYKLSQTQLFNKYHLRSVLQDHGTYSFIKDIIKDFCITRGIFDSKSRHKKINKSRINKWKNWLRSHYQYNLSQTKWSQLVPKKWRNRINQRRTILNKDSMKLDLYKKEKKWKKNYRYDLLSSRYINYEDKKDSYIYGSTLRVNEDQKIPYNFNTLKPQSFYILISIVINDYLEKGYIIDTEKNLYRKYLDCRILHFRLRKNINIESWTNTHIDTKINKNIKAKTNNYQKIEKKKISDLTIHQEISPSDQKSVFFDWMGMNQEKLYRTISNPEPWLFPEFVLLFDSYKIKPWIIPIKSLLFHLHFYENISQSEKINVNKKTNLPISSNQKEYLELEIENSNEKKEKKEQQGQEHIVSDPREQNKKKDIEEDYTGSNIKRGKKKKQPKSEKEAELDFFLQKYFLFQLRWDDPLNQRIINNIKVYCLLLRLINPTEIAISSIQRGEMLLDVMLIQKDLTLIELIKKGILIIEPIRLSRKRHGEFLIYQTIGISLVDKSKRQTNGKGIKKRYADKKNFDVSIVRHNNMLVNGNTNYYDFLVPENILSPRRRRELRILICFNYRNWNVVDRNPIFVFCNENTIKNSKKYEPFLNKDKHLNTDANKFIKFKFFLWPNCRLEDLACMNRYWFDTNNGSRFSMSRIHMYPQFRIS